MRNTLRERIALYLPSLRGGGAERVMVVLANGFVARGLRVDLVLAKAEGPYLAYISPDVRIVDLKSQRVLFSLPRLVRYLRSERPRILLCAMNHVNVLALMARALAGGETRVVISEHNTLTAAGTPERLSRMAVIRLLMQWLYPRADAIVGVSRGVSEDLARFLRLPAKQVTTIYNPVVTQSLLRQAEVPHDHPWLAPGSPPVVLGVGRLTQQKDFPTLIRAFARVRAHRSCRLVILGEGELRPALQALVAELGVTEDVLLFGFTDNPFVWMRRAGVFVLSSAWEGLPTVLIEAMACGAPVISTDCPSGSNEILEGGKWGCLVPVGDVQALAEAVATTLDDGGKLDVTARAADFGVDRAVEEYFKIMMPLCGSLCKYPIQ
jgi:glycosyltransferase involved in cell wall biosynthesis